MSEKNDKRDRAVENITVPLTTWKHLLMERNMFRCLLGLMIFEANQGAGDVWRAVFSPALLEVGKTFDLKISTVFESGLPTDFLALAREQLKIELPHNLSMLDLNAFKSLIPIEVLKKAMVVSVQVKPEVINAEAEKAAEAAKRGELLADDTIKVGAGGNEVETIKGEDFVFKVHRNGEPSDPTAPMESRPRSSFKYCTRCSSTYNADAEHRCTPPVLH